MTVENIDNDDNDSKFDNDDSGVSSDDELIEWIININDAAASTIAISVTGEKKSIKVWETPNKAAGSEYTFNAQGIGADVNLSQTGTNQFSKSFWIEGVKKHNSPRAVKLKVKSQADGKPCEEEIAITVIGIDSIVWRGRGNGYQPNHPAGNYNSNTLDQNDVNFNDPNYNANNSEGLSSYRVFAGARLGDAIPKNIVDVEIYFSTPPVENFDLYLKSFDIDDPFLDPARSSANPDFFVDPNDKTSTSGVYNGCQVIANNIGYDYAKYDANNDNRGVAEISSPRAVVDNATSTLFGDDTIRLKSGIFLENVTPTKLQVISKKTSIAKIKATSGQNSVKVGFVTSRQPGDNYRIAVNADKDFLYNLRNEDRFDGFMIVDNNIAGVGGNTGEIERSLTSDILTVWRTFHLEIDEMQNGFNFNSNSEAITINGFGGNNSKASTATVIYSLENVQGDDISPNMETRDTIFNSDGTIHAIYPQGYWQGRMMNGELRLGQNNLGNPSDDVIVCRRGENSKIRRHGKKYVESKIGETFNLIQGINGGGLPFILKDNTGKNPLTGTVDEIITSCLTCPKNYKYELILDGGALSNSYIGGHLQIGGYQDIDVIITSVDIAQSEVNSSSLRIPAFIADDDSNEVFMAAEIKIDTLKKIYRRVYLEVEKLPALYNTTDVKIEINMNAADIENKLKDDRNSKDIETRDFWVGYICKIFQINMDRDGDPYNELKGTGLGYATGIYTGTMPSPGGNFAVVSTEPIRDALVQLNKPATINDINKAVSYTAAHELGHSFGLGHGNGILGFEPALQEFTSNNMGLMETGLDKNPIIINRYCNFLRCRIGSPGQTPLGGTF